MGTIEYATFRCDTVEVENKLCSDFQVRESVINMLSSTEMDDLPVVVKFILQSVADNEAFEVSS